MFGRRNRREEGAVATADTPADADAPAVQERDPNVTERGPVGRERPVAREEAMIRQRERFGGLNWGAAFFGWLVAVGIAVILLAILSAAGTALGLSNNLSTNQLSKNAATIGAGGAIALIVVLMLAYYAGGYVAGRMSRFDGGRQGFGVWLVGLIITILFALAGVLFGSKYNVLSALNLPRIPVKEGDIVTGGIVALVVVLLGTLLASILGGTLGRRYHLRVDRAALQ
jgi:hypothetical protein